MRLLDRDQILRLFEDLSEVLQRRGTGAAMALAYNARRATRDLDAVFQPKDEVYAAAAVVAAQHDLPDDWLNASPTTASFTGCEGSEVRPAAPIVAGHG